MPIAKFRFEDRFRGWQLEEVEFGDFNLLVGLSGVGKTMILEALNKIDLVLDEGTAYGNGCQWEMTVDWQGATYCWSVEVDLRAGTSATTTTTLPGDQTHNGEPRRAGPPILKESITKDGSGHMVNRTADTFQFQGTDLPRLSSTESAISLLGDEDAIAPLRQALARFMYSRAPVWGRGFARYDPNVIKEAREQRPTIEDLREAPGMTLLDKAYVLQEDHGVVFRQVMDAYTDIFPMVRDVCVRPFSVLDMKTYMDYPMDWLTFGIREDGVDDWITGDRLSMGMLRVLTHLFELALAPNGTVFLIDEIENSLGVNCLPQLMEQFMARADELQFILTSHHPYVINNVPKKWWKVVTRKGSTVTVRDASEIKALDTASSHDAFTLLMNAPEYEEGIR